MSHDAAERLEHSLPLIVGQREPELVQRWSRPRLGPARGGTHWPVGRRMRGHPVVTGSDAPRSKRQARAGPEARLWAGPQWVGEV